jgi:hypothetical protein
MLRHSLRAPRCVGKENYPLVCAFKVLQAVHNIWKESNTIMQHAPNIKDIAVIAIGKRT